MKAFPHKVYLENTDPTVQNPVIHAGMDLRDYFAAKAMQQFLNWDLNTPINKQMGFEWVSQYSYKIADAMIKERGQ